MNEDNIKSHWNERWVLAKFKDDTCNTSYQISNYGRIKSVHRGSGKEKIIKGSFIARGFNVLNVRLVNGKRDSVMIHRFVAEHFVKRKGEKYLYVIHLDGNNGNNKWNNLKWLTHEEWVEHMLNTPNRKKAEKERSRKLTESQVKMIKRMLHRGKIKYSIIAKKFNISITQVKRIQSGENWNDVSHD